MCYDFRVRRPNNPCGGGLSGDIGLNIPLDWEVPDRSGGEKVPWLETGSDGVPSLEIGLNGSCDEGDAAFDPCGDEGPEGMLGGDGGGGRLRKEPKNDDREGGARPD